MKKNFIITPFLVLLFLLCSITVSYSSTFDTYYKQGMSFFKSRDYLKAYEAFLTAFELSPGHWEVDFYLGRSAFETGNYEMAVMAFERSLITNPKAVRVKLEMARAYQKLGVNDMARKYCNEVLLTNPPETVKQNIEKFLVYIDKTEQRHFLRATVTAGVDWNDNVWASPTSSIIDTVLGEVTLIGNSATEKHDWIVNTSVQVDHTYSSSYKDMMWGTTGTAYKAVYNKESDLDILYLDIDSGPQFIFGKDISGISFVGDYIEIEEKKYQTSAGVKAFYRHMFTPYLFIAADVQHKRKFYEQNSNRDARNVAVSFDTTYLVKNTWLNLFIAAEKERATDNEFSYKRYAAKLSLSRELPWDVTLFGNYDFVYSRYDGIADLFTEKRRDYVHRAGCGLKKRLWESSDRDKSLSVVLKYQYTHADSNIDLYEYRKNLIQTFFEYRF